MSQPEKPASFFFASNPSRLAAKEVAHTHRNGDWRELWREKDDERDEGAAAGEARPQQPLPPARTEGRCGRSPDAEAQARRQNSLKLFTFFDLTWSFGLPEDGNFRAPDQR